MSRTIPILLAALLALAAILFVIHTTLRNGGEPEEVSGGSTDPEPDEVPLPPGGGLGDGTDPLPDDGPPEVDPEKQFAAFGRVLAVSGGPAAGVGVGVIRTWEKGSELYRMPVARTGADGRFRVEGIPPDGSRLAFFPELPGRISEVGIRRRPVSLTPPIEGMAGEEVDLGDYWLSMPGSLEGYVLDEDGSPAPGVQVVAGLLLAGLGQSATSTDPEGRFRLEGLLAGDYYVHASVNSRENGPRFCRVAPVRPGTARLEFRLHAGNTLLLRFRTIAEPDRPLLLTSGSLFLTGSTVVRSFGGRRTSPALDHWRVQLEPGLHQLRFTAQGYLPAELGEVRITEDRETVVEVPLRRE